MSFEKVIGSLVKEASREPESKYASMSFSDMCAILPHVLPLLSEAEKRAATGDLVKYIPSVGPTIAGGMRGHEDPDTGALAGAARGSIGGSIGVVAGGTLGAAAGLGTAAAGARLANRLGAPIAPQLNGLEAALTRTHSVGERALARGASASRMRSIALKGIAGGVRKNPVGAAVMAAGLGLPLVGGIAGGLYGQGVGTDVAMPAKVAAPEDTGYTPRDLKWHEKFRPLAGVLGGAALGTAAAAPVGAGLINRGHPLLGGAAMALGGTAGTVLGGMAAQHSLSTPARISQAHMIRKSLQEGLAGLPPESAVAGDPDYDSFVEGIATMDKEIAHQERDWMARSGRKHASKVAVSSEWIKKMVDKAHRSGSMFRESFGERRIPLEPGHARGVALRRGEESGIRHFEAQASQASRGMPDHLREAAGKKRQAAQDAIYAALDEEEKWASANSISAFVRAGGSL